MQTKHLCVWTKGEDGAPLNRLKPSSKIFYRPFQGGTTFVDFYVFFSCLVLAMPLYARLFICALWLPAGKGLTSWLSFVVSICEFVTFPLVSWVRRGTWLYQFLISAPLLTCITNISFYWSCRKWRKYLEAWGQGLVSFFSIFIMIHQNTNDKKSHDIAWRSFLMKSRNQHHLWFPVKIETRQPWISRYNYFIICFVL